MKKKLLFITLILILLCPWPVAYAHEHSMAGTQPGGVTVTSAGSADKPTLEVVGGGIGGLSPGHLFYIDSVDCGADVSAALHLTNSDELVKYFRYVILKVGVWKQAADGEWQRARLSSGEVVPDTYLSMQNGMVTYRLPGYARYRISIDGGCNYSLGAVAGGSPVSPSFYLGVE